MRCSASPTTSTAASRHPERSEAKSKDSAAATVEAIVFREILKPLAAGLGPVAEIAIAPIADALAGAGKR